MKVQEKSLKYWEALPIPREWRTVGNVVDEGEKTDQVIVRSILNEWLGTHPMDGD